MRGTEIGYGGTRRGAAEWERKVPARGIKCICPHPWYTLYRKGTQLHLIPPDVKSFAAPRNQMQIAKAPYSLHQ
eukprot:3895326-Rhodomonas_salina.1